MRRILAAILCILMLAEAGCALANPTPGTGCCGRDYCFWETPMDITDTDAIWNMLIQPMTIITGHQRERILILAEPDEEAEPVGEVTCDSQGVHLLETLDSGWCLIECHSSSDGGSQLDVYGDLVRGYVPADRVKTVPSKTEYGLVVDKMTQRMYVFHDGEMITILRVSTGKPSKAEPQNETEGGEFHLISMVGSYVAGYNVICENAIRFNEGNLIHNVPYDVNDDGEKDYWKYERYLGQRASNGCIRVQRRRTPEGINMTWLWHRLFDQKRTRLVIWEDCPGRQLAVPDPDTPVYVLPGMSGAYHRKQGCYSIDQAYHKKMTAIPYSQLEDEAYSGLANCYYCNPPLRRSAIEELNLQYAAVEEAQPSE